MHWKVHKSTFFLLLLIIGAPYFDSITAFFTIQKIPAARIVVRLLYRPISNMPTTQIFLQWKLRKPSFLS